MNALTENTTCGECGAKLNDPGEFHPYAFCVMRKRGQSPWLEMHKHKPNRGRLPSRPPVVMGRSHAYLDSLMAMAANTEKAARFG